VVVLAHSPLPQSAPGNTRSLRVYSQAAGMPKYCVWCTLINAFDLKPTGAMLGMRAQELADAQSLASLQYSGHALKLEVMC